VVLSSVNTKLSGAQRLLLASAARSYGVGLLGRRLAYGFYSMGGYSQLRNRLPPKHSLIKFRPHFLAGPCSGLSFSV
jgi:hypothetical protein